MNLHQIPVRWRLFGVLFLLSFLSYLMRQNIHVAGELMMPELQLSELEMGWIYASFIWGYALFQSIWPPANIAGRGLARHFGIRANRSFTRASLSIDNGCYRSTTLGAIYHGDSPCTHVPHSGGGS